MDDKEGISLGLEILVLRQVVAALIASHPNPAGLAAKLEGAEQGLLAEMSEVPIGDTDLEYVRTRLASFRELLQARDGPAGSAG